MVLEPVVSLISPFEGPCLRWVHGTQVWAPPLCITVDPYLVGLLGVQGARSMF